MGKEMRMIYDDDGDILDVSLGVPLRLFRGRWIMIFLSGLIRIQDRLWGFRF